MAAVKTATPSGPNLARNVPVWDSGGLLSHRHAEQQDTPYTFGLKTLGLLTNQAAVIAEWKHLGR